MAPDDTVAAKLPRLNVPGVQTPPPQPPGLDPMEGLKNMARDAANAVRTAGAAVAPVMNFGGDATRIGNELKTTGGMVADKVLGGIFGDQYQRERTNPAAGADPFAYKGAPIPAPPVSAAPTIAPPAAAPVAGVPAPAAPGADKFDKQVQLASLISAQNNSRTPVSNPYEGPAAGVAPPSGGVHGSIGVEGFKQQLANIQALQTPAPPTGGEGAAADTETWQDKQNRQTGEKWALEEQMRALKSINPNTAGGRAQLAAMGHLISSGQSAAASRYGADASSGASMHNARLGYQGGRERDAANLQATGMQVSGQDRNSQRSANASMYGHDMHANTAMQDAMLRAQTALQGHQVQRDTNAATNNSALERTRMMVEEGRHRTDQTALAEQNKLMAMMHGFKPELLDPRYGVNAAGQRIQFGLVQPKDKKAEK